MLRIVQCTDSFLPVSDGVGRVSFEYASALALRGHESYVVTPQVNDGFRGKYPFEIVDFTCLQLPGGSQSSAAALDMHYLARMDGLKPDIIHTHSPGAAGMEAARLSDKLRVPLVGTFHPQFYRKYLLPTGDEKQDRLTTHFIMDYFNRCDEIWTVSDSLRDLLFSLGFSGNIEVFENGVSATVANQTEVDRAKAHFHILPNAPLLICVGNASQMKNLPRILDAAAMLQRRGTAFQLLFVGTGGEDAAVREHIRERSLDGVVRFVGHVPDSALLNGLYAAADLCLFPLQALSAGLVIREAAAQHTPSLVLAGTAASRLIAPAVNGLTCGDDAEDMADTIDAFLSRTDRAAVGAAAAESLTIPWEAVIDRVEARYQTLATGDKTALKRKRGLFRKELQQVDSTTEKRAADLFWRYLKQDMSNIYPYPHRAEKPAAAPPPDPHPLPRATPESQGVPSTAVNALFAAIDGDEAAAAQAMLVLRHGKVIAEASWAPYSLTLPHQLYSLSKSVTATAIGMLADEGKLDIDERLCDIFFDKMPHNPSHPSYTLTVRHLLNMSTGAVFNEIGSALGADWEKEFFQNGVHFPAGTEFFYNSMNTYMLAAIVRRRTGETLMQYLTPRLFEPLGIADAYWETCPNGTEKGGWGLSLTPESVAKIGQLYLNGGAWTVDGKQQQLVSRAWIEAATSPQIATPKGEITFGYGHQIWMTAHKGAFLFNGAFGQYMLALPDLDMLVVLFSGTARLFAEGGVLDAVDRAFMNLSDRPLSENPAALSALHGTLDALTVRGRAPFSRPVSEGSLSVAEAAARLNGHVYTMERNVSGLFPFTLSNVENSYSPGTARIAFQAEPAGGLMMTFVEGDNAHCLTAGEGYTAGTVTQLGETYRVEVSAQAAETADAWTLTVCVHFIETPFTRILTFTFQQDRVTVKFDEFPTQESAATMLLQLTGISRQQMFRALIPLLKRDKMQHSLHTFATVTVQGKL